MNTERIYDVIVIGGGAAGHAAGRAAATAGARTIVFDHGEAGGLAVLRGGVPTLALLHAARLAHAAAHHRTPGVGRANLALDFGGLMASKATKIERLQRQVVAEIERGGYEVVRAHARFVGPDLVEADGLRYRFAKGAVVATGSKPVPPDIHGLGSVAYWTSDDIAQLTDRPRSLIIVGGGPAGLELAQLFARLHTKVTLVSRRAPGADVDPVIAAELAAMLEAEADLTLLAGWNPLRAAQDARGRIVVDLEGADESRTIDADALLIATGRAPALDGLGLEVAGIAVQDGRIACSSDLRTSNQRVFAAGDAAGEPYALHVAEHEGRTAGLGAAQASGASAVRVDVRVVFTDPPLALVGTTLEEARAAGRDVVSASLRAVDLARGIATDVKFGAMTLVALRESGVVVGAQMFVPQADELAHAIVAVMFKNGTVRDLAALPWYHPTFGEGIAELARRLAGA